LTLALVLAAALAVACVVVVALPFLREPEPESDSLDDLDADERQRLELLEARDRALAALRELEFDHPHRDGLGRGLPLTGRRAPPRRRNHAASARARLRGGSTWRWAKLEVMGRRMLALVGLVLSLVVVAPAAADDPSDEKASVDARIASLQGRYHRVQGA
jgi:hypothetical protein